MRYICFAAGPLHLISIKELVERNKKDQFHIYMMVRKHNIRINTQMDSTAKFLNLKNVKKYYQSHSRYILAFKNLIFVYKLFKEYKNSVNTFVIVDFRNSLMHFLRRIFNNSKFILIDDGFHTYINYRKYMDFRHYLPHLQYEDTHGLIYKSILFGSQFRSLLFKKFDIFSVYAKELDLPEHEYNDLSHIRNIIKNKNNLKYSDSLVFFAGTKLSERKALTLEQELNIVKKLKIYWARKNKKIVYVAKRSSSPEKLKLIKEKLSVDVEIFELPLELALLTYGTNNELPTIICSLGSTLNKTLPMLYDNIISYIVTIDKVSMDVDLREDLNFSKEFLLKSLKKSSIKSIQKHIINL